MSMHIFKTIAGERLQDLHNQSLQSPSAGSNDHRACIQGKLLYVNSLQVGSIPISQTKDLQEIDLQQHFRNSFCFAISLETWGCWNGGGPGGGKLATCKEARPRTASWLRLPSQKRPNTSCNSHTCWQTIPYIQACPSNLTTIHATGHVGSNADTSMQTWSSYICTIHMCNNSMHVNSQLPGSSRDCKHLHANRVFIYRVEHGKSLQGAT